MVEFNAWALGHSTLRWTTTAQAHPTACQVPSVSWATHVCTALYPRLNPRLPGSGRAAGRAARPLAGAYTMKLAACKWLLPSLGTTTFPTVNTDLDANSQFAAPPPPRCLCLALLTRHDGTVCNAPRAQVPLPIS